MGKDLVVEKSSARDRASPRAGKMPAGQPAEPALSSPKGTPVLRDTSYLPNTSLAIVANCMFEVPS
jgi:hypothetical protein